VLIRIFGLKRTLQIAGVAIALVTIKGCLGH